MSNKNIPTYENVVMTEYSELMRQSYIDYSMSVIVSRAIPDVRDGLKPVQRRTLFDMYELGLTYDKSYKKCARVVGDTMGKYHPHGDSSIYESLVIMSQDFKKGATLVDGHGNFGSIEGDTPAAMRYTECRLQKISQDTLLSDLDKDVVDFTSNFDDSLLEPEVLPSRLPNILINGAEGIAVGMVTSIPPHNVADSIDSLIYSLKHEDATISKLLNILKGPDFPTGGFVTNKSDLLNIYETGKGRISVRGKVEIENEKNGKIKLLITEIPYSMVGAGIGKFLVDVANLAENKETNDILDISNQTSKDGIRIVIELKKGTDVDNFLNLLYKKTKLQDTISVSMLAVDDKKPRLMNLKDILTSVGNFQKEIFNRKYTTLLKKEKEKAEIQEGLLKAIDVIDVIIAVLRGAKTLLDVKHCLMNGNTQNIKFRSIEYEMQAKEFSFTAKQTSAILDMRMQKLVGLELLSLKKEYQKTLKNIEKYTILLSDEEKMKDLIIDELLNLKKLYGTARKTQLIDAKEMAYEKIKIIEQDIVVLIDKFGYIRSVDDNTYKRNSKSIDEENKFVIKCKNTEKLSLFTEKGNMYVIKADEIPLGKLRDKGMPLDNISNFKSTGEILIYVSIMSKLVKKTLLFVTKNAMIKKVNGVEFDVISKKTIIATRLAKDDEICTIRQIDDFENVVLQTNFGIFLRFSLNEVSNMKKNAVGVRGMRLEKDDYLVNAYVFNPKASNIQYKTLPEAMESLTLEDLYEDGLKVENKNDDADDLQDIEIFQDIFNQDCIIYNDIKIQLSLLRLAKRDTKGSRIDVEKIKMK